MTTWPAYVPTLEDARPEASSARANSSAAAVDAAPNPANAPSRVLSAERRAGEQRGRDEQHRHVHQPGQAHGGVTSTRCVRSSAGLWAAVRPRWSALTSAECR